MILDTTFLVDILRGDKEARAKAAALERGPDPPRVPTVAAYELFEGIERSRNPPRELMAVRDLLLDYALVPLEATHAMRAGTLSGSLVRRGVVMDDIDALIAGTALAERDSVLTRNVKDFEKVPDLTVATY